MSSKKGKPMTRTSLFMSISVFGLWCATPVNAAEFSMTTTGGKVFSMEVDGDRVTGETNELTLCGDAVDAVKRIRLWMPAHGHGSTPVQLGATNEGCRVATKVNFTMSGVWDLEVQLDDGDAGVFQVEVD